MNGLRFLESVVPMPLFPLPVRSILVTVKNANGSETEVLISPGSKIERTRYDGAWKISDIVAPNLFHHAGVPKALALYPNARTWGVVGLREKRADVQWQSLLGTDAWPYGDVLQPFLIAGMPKVNEAVFVHRPSRSLIVTDLCFNMQGMNGFGPRLILSLFGTFNKLGVSRFFLAFAKDRAAFRESVARVLEQDFENIIVSHGVNVIGDGKSALRRALAERGVLV